MSSPITSSLPSKSSRPFLAAVLRGLAVVLPPLLTIVILVWIFQTVTRYVIEPLSAATREVLARSLADVRTTLPDAKVTRNDTVFESQGKQYKQLRHGANVQFVPLSVYATVEKELGSAKIAATGLGIYRQYVEIAYLRSYFLLPAVAAAFVLVMYVLGRIFAAGVGRFFWNLIEQIIHRLPLVRGVYAAVKQVTDYMLNENAVKFNRVVAVQYPCEGVWTVAFVTGDGMAAVSLATEQPMLSVLFPTLPMPFTGNTRMVPRSQVVDLKLTIEQACQYVLSCGVIVPPHQLPELMETKQQSVAIETRS